jgi:O-antigen/teichoic acid export membrane protein
VANFVGGLLWRLATEKAILWSLLIRVGSALLLIVSSIVLARTLGVENFGIYSFALAVMAVLQLPATAGTFTLVLRETSAGLARSDYSAVKGLWRWSIRFVGKLSVAVFIIAGSIILIWGPGWDEPKSQGLLIAALTVPIVGATGLFSARLRGLGLIVFSQIPEQVVKPAILVVLLLGIGQVAGGLTSTVALALYLLTSFIGLLVLVAVFNRVKPDRVVNQFADFSNLGRWRRALVPLTMLSGLQVVNAQAALILLGAISNVEAAAELKVAASLAIFGTFAAQVVTFVLGPEFSRANATLDAKEMQNLARRSVGLSAITTLPILLFLILFAPLIIEIAFGDPYLGAAVPVIVVSLGYIATILMGACSMILTMIGKEGVAVIGHTIGMVVNLLLLSLLATTMGSTGAAVAISTSMVVTQVFLLAGVSKYAAIDPTIISIFRRSS